jgi:hypothetical protein
LFTNEVNELLSTTETVAWITFSMSLTEILEELPKLKTEERDTILHRIEELDELASPEMLAAIDQADASPSDRDLSAEDVRHARLDLGE